MDEHSEWFSGRRCLVTGGLGFIGSNLALALSRAGAQVTVVDACYPRHGSNEHNLEGPDGESIERIRVPFDDLAARAAAANAEYVFNLAGQVSHVDSQTDPLFDLDVNTRSQISLLEGLRVDNSDAVVVFTSTRQLFGRPKYLPVDEEHPVHPVDVNGISKQATEQLHLLYADLYGIRASIVRITNVFGPRQRLRDDLQGFLPIFIRRALAGEALEVFGEGEQIRDCLYVDDVVDCLLRMAASPDAVGEIFIAGNDEHLSLAQIAQAIVDAAGSGSVTSVPWPADRDAIDIGSYFSDSAKAKRILGWTATTPFRTGIARTIDYYRQHLDWYL